ncbi:hypothetical protein MLD38_032840 [Melastoma candidum]|uniref:Uncharacterized protein n=1 Tax=Melastoma candidum TaxID=119954 RepID=A0ACB9M4Q2_9MYRT|nr:hypothetical protein MLD38_032840 [Melastoma candidum]
MREVLGGGRVADVLLWKDRNVSATLLAGTTVVWFLFEVVEYNFVTLVCHVSITAMLAIFIWRSAAEMFSWEHPRLPRGMIDGSTFNYVASKFHVTLNQLLSKMFDVACGKDFPQFIAVISLLYVLSVIGSCCSFLNLLYLGLLSMEILPFLYDRYEDEVDRLAGSMIREMKNLWERLDSQLLNKIPRGPVKEKKLR